MVTAEGAFPAARCCCNPASAYKLILNSEIDVFWNDGFMVTFHIILRYDAVVFDSGLAEKIGGVGFLKQGRYCISEKVIRRLMREEGIEVIKCRKKRYSSYLGELSPAVKNIVNRDFSASSPNEKWLTDISEFATSKGKIYLSVIRDCYNDEIIAYKIGNKPTAALANDTLSEAIKRLGTSNIKPIIHSDRGCHYRWPGWIQITVDNGLVRSMSKKGCSPDNSACEGFLGRMKTECFYNHSLEALSLDELKKYLDKYIQWYNNVRIKNTLGGLSPVQYRLNNVN